MFVYVGDAFTEGRGAAGGGLPKSCLEARPEVSELERRTRRIGWVQQISECDI